MTLQLPTILFTCLYFYHSSLFALSSELAPLPLENTQITWNLWKQNKNVAIFYQNDINKEIVPVKALVKVDSTLSGFLLFVQDTNKASSWLTNIQKSSVIKKHASNDIVFKNTFHTFWPVQAREIILRSVYSQNPDLTLEIDLHDMNHFEAREGNTMRMKLLNGHWHITPRLNPLAGTAEIQTSLDIKYQFTVDGKGNLPFWLYKRLSLNGIWKSMNNLVEQLPLSPWQHKKIPLIKELTP